MTETLDKMKAAGMPMPDIAVKRTGQFDTVAGAKCEVLTFDWKMALRFLRVRERRFRLIFPQQSP
jgi:hypothetical protein